MICRKCNTEFDSSRPDANGVVVCPTCGTQYRKETAPAASPASAPDPSPIPSPAPAASAPGKANGFAKALNTKIGGKVPVWCCALIGVVVVAVLLIVLLNLSSDGASSPKALLSKMEDAMNGDAKAMWETINPELKTDNDDENDDKISYNDVKLYMKETARFSRRERVTLEYVSFEDISDRYADTVYQAVGKLYFILRIEENGKYNSHKEEIKIVKIDGRWYTKEAGIS